MGGSKQRITSFDFTYEKYTLFRGVYFLNRYVINMSTLAITSMYANPLHPGHIECLELSKSQTGAEELWVIVNNDHQAELKRGTKSFQDEDFRMKVVESLKPVDRVFLSIDTDSSVCASLKYLIHEAKTSGRFEKIIFTKGGDRFATEIPEAVILRSE